MSNPKGTNIRTSFTYKHGKGQVNTEPSLTVQGETMTIQEMMKRAQIQGHFPENTSNAPFMDVDNIDEINEMYSVGLDLTDLAEHKKHLEETSERIDQLILEEKSKKIKSAAKPPQKKPDDKEQSGSKEGEKKEEKAGT